MRTAGNEFKYDVFISYSHLDQAWVQSWLLPRLEAEGLHVCIDFRDFELGAPTLTEIERAVVESRKTLLVLTPQYLASEWTEFENILAQNLDPAARQRRLLPLLRKPCELPLRIRTLTYLDFTRPDQTDFQLNRLLTSLSPGTAKGTARSRWSTLGPESRESKIVAIDYNLAAIRELLTAAFSDEELTTLCFDHFRAVYEDFASGMSKGQKMQRLIDYCERHAVIDSLLSEVAQRNPSQYRRFERRLKA